MWMQCWDESSVVVDAMLGWFQCWMDAMLGGYAIIHCWMNVVLN